MARIKLTKNEMKSQREALARFERFLPMLQLKKQQLQMEIQLIDAMISVKKSQQEGIRCGLDAWVKLFAGEAEGAAAQDLVSIQVVTREEGNIAGVCIPMVSDICLQRAEPDLFSTPPWYDDALEVLDQLIRLRIELESLEEQKRLISEELRIVSQRVNLFEKVKIPECKESIRVIKIFLGDQQTAAVVRGKIAKARTVAYDEG